MSRSQTSRRGGGGMDRAEQVSRALSRTLRHSAKDENLSIRDDGYVNVAELLQSRKYKQLKLDFPTLCQAVAENSKKRFKLMREDADDPAASEASDDVVEFALAAAADPDPDLSKYFIRAVQGHSIKVDDSQLLKPIDATNLPSLCVHGTYYSALTLILESGGLSKMGRTHIHCAAGLPKASIHPETGEEIPPVLSGMRFNAEVLFFIDVAKGVQDGVKFWRSDNDVILTSGVDGNGVLPMEYVIRVEDAGHRAGGGDLWTRDEGIIKEWPVTGKGKKSRGQSGADGGRGAGRGKGKGRGKPRVQVEDELDEVSSSLGDTRI